MASPEVIIAIPTLYSLSCVATSRKVRIADHFTFRQFDDQPGKLRDAWAGTGGVCGRMPVFQKSSGMLIDKSRRDFASARIIESASARRMTKSASGVCSASAGGGRKAGGKKRRAQDVSPGQRFGAENQTGCQVELRLVPRSSQLFRNAFSRSVPLSETDARGVTRASLDLISVRTEPLLEKRQHAIRCGVAVPMASPPRPMSRHCECRS